MPIYSFFVVIDQFRAVFNLLSIKFIHKALLVKGN